MSLKSHPGVQGANFNINKEGIEHIVNIQFEHAHSQSSVSNLFVLRNPQERLLE